MHSIRTIHIFILAVDQIIKDLSVVLNASHECFVEIRILPWQTCASIPCGQGYWEDLFGCEDMKLRRTY